MPHWVNKAGCTDARKARSPTQTLSQNRALHGLRCGLDRLRAAWGFRPKARHRGRGHRSTNCAHQGHDKGANSRGATGLGWQLHPEFRHSNTGVSNCAALGNLQRQARPEQFAAVPKNPEVSSLCPQCKKDKELPYVRARASRLMAAWVETVLGCVVHQRCKNKLCMHPCTMLTDPFASLGFTGLHWAARCSSTACSWPSQSCAC